MSRSPSPSARASWWSRPHRDRPEKPPAAAAATRSRKGMSRPRVPEQSTVLPCRASPLPILSCGSLSLPPCPRTVPELFP